MMPRQACTSPRSSQRDRAPPPCLSATTGPGVATRCSVTFGSTPFELFPFHEPDLDYLRELVRAVLDGRVEESGSSWRDTHGRI